MSRGNSAAGAQAVRGLEPRAPEHESPRPSAGAGVGASLLDEPHNPRACAAEAWIFSEELVDFVREERERREREQRILKDFEYVLSDLSEIEMDASDVRHALSSAEMDLEMALEWLEVGDLKGAIREVADALRKLRQAEHDARKVEFQAEESARYIKHAYFGEPLFDGDGDDD